MRPLNVLKFWYIQRVKGFDPPGDEPWMTPEGAERFGQELSRATRYVEFGAGATTILADRQEIPTVSVESDRFYAKAVASRLSESSSVVQINVDVGITLQLGRPLLNTSAKSMRYVSAPFNGLPFPDFILVDGRWRVACALESARQANLHGVNATLMIDDYARREHYRSVEAFLGRPEIVGTGAIFKVGDQRVPRQAVLQAARDVR